MADYTEKIRNLLALAGSDNEHEARSALLMARKLMAKHKISEQDMERIKDDKVTSHSSGITYSARRDPWVYALANTVAKHHCCRNFQLCEKKKQTAEIGFLGFEEDVMICRELFIYAVDCVRAKTKDLKKVKNIRAADSYGYGFVIGLDEAYEKQQKQYDLILVVPEQVKNAANEFRQRRFSQKMDKPKVEACMFKKGMEDGRKFKEQKRIG